jgi:hypothetical protein
MATAITPDDVVNQSFGWALWKVLDYLGARFLPGSLLDSPQRAAAASGHGAALPSGVAALGSVDSAEVETALASLNDDSSPLVQTLAWALGAQGIDARERQRRLEASLAVLTRGEAFALLAVLLYQIQQIA